MLIKVLAILKAKGVDKVEVFEVVGPSKRNNPLKHNSNLAVNHDIGKKPTGKQNDICRCCGLSGLWSHTCCTQKYFVDLY